MGKNKRKVSVTEVSGKHKVVPYQILKYVVHEFGFALLLLLFSMGVLSLGLSLQYFGSIKSFDMSLRAQGNSACQVPLAPSAVSARAGDFAGELIVRWESVPQVTGYWLRVEAQQNTQDRLNVPVRSDLNQMTIRGLSGGELYRVQLSAENSCGRSNEGEAVMAMAGSIEPPVQPGVVIGPELEPMVRGTEGLVVDNLWGIDLSDESVSPNFWREAVLVAWYEYGVLFMIGALILFLNAAWLAFYSVWGIGKGVKRVGGSILGMG